MEFEGIERDLGDVIKALRVRKAESNRLHARELTLALDNIETGLLWLRVVRDIRARFTEEKD